MPNKMILVTGGAGYIGSHTCKALAGAGFTPVVYDNLSEGHLYAVQWGPFVEGDIRDQSRLHQTLLAYRPVGVIHFAACASVAESMKNPAKYYDNNVYGTWNLLQAMREYGLVPLVVSSSCSVYGEPKSVPIQEDHPQAPLSVYGRTKQIMEQMILDYARAYGVPFALLRYFNACGADPEGQIGEDHREEGHLIPRVIGACFGIYPPIEIYGNDYPTEDGFAVRDYIHVQDLADAHVRALGHLLAGKANLVLNIGTGKGLSVQEIVKAVEGLMKKEVPTLLAPRRSGDPACLVADPTAAYHTLGFSAQHSDLQTILSSAFAWHRRKE